MHIGLGHDTLSVTNVKIGDQRKILRDFPILKVPDNFK